jgi:hypothetical protein
MFVDDVALVRRDSVDSVFFRRSAADGPSLWSAQPADEQRAAHQHHSRKQHGAPEDGCRCAPRHEGHEDADDGEWSTDEQAHEVGGSLLLWLVHSPRLAAEEKAYATAQHPYRI